MQSYEPHEAVDRLVRSLAPNAEGERFSIGSEALGAFIQEGNRISYGPDLIHGFDGAMRLATYLEQNQSPKAAEEVVAAALIWGTRLHARALRDVRTGRAGVDAQCDLRQAATPDTPHGGKTHR